MQDYHWTFKRNIICLYLRYLPFLLAAEIKINK